MQNNPGVTVTEDAIQDDRGVPLKNLQAEMTRKLEEMEKRTSDQIGQLTQKLAELLQPTTPEPDKPTEKYDPRVELQTISRDPRRYVEDIVAPLRKENEQLRSVVNETWAQSMRTRWDLAGAAIAAREGKRDWQELSKDVQDGVTAIIKSNGWNNSPERAMNAYSQWKSERSDRLEREPERIERVNAQSEGSGRSSGKLPHRTISSDQIEGIAHTMPNDPRYKENMELLAKVQRGEIKIE